MRRLLNKTLLLGLLLLVANSGLRAQTIQPVIPFQGVLVDAKNNVVSSAPSQVNFEVYTVGVSVPVYSYTANNSQFSFARGMLSYNIGQDKPFDAGVDFSKPMYMVITYDGHPITVQLYPAVYAMYASTSGVATNMKTTNLRDVASSTPQDKQVLKWDAALQSYKPAADEVGTANSGISNVTTSTPITGGGNTSTVNIALSPSGATPGSYGSSTKVPAITIDNYGRVLNIAESTISTSINVDSSSKGPLISRTTSGSSTTITIRDSVRKADTAMHVTSSVLPVGSIMAFSGDSAAAVALVGTDWAPCWGQSILSITSAYALTTTQQAKLVSVLSSWPNSGAFLPDFRGYFLRGAYAGGLKDANGLIRDSISASNPSRVTGNYQTDAFQGHWHNIGAAKTSGNATKVAVDANSGVAIPVSTSSDYLNGWYAGMKADDVVQDTALSNNTVSGQPRKFAETRPKNIAVNYIIKIR